MSSSDRNPDKVSRSSSGAIPGTGDLGGTIHKTTIEKDGTKTTGTGWSKDQADKAAGDKYSNSNKK